MAEHKPRRAILVCGGREERIAGGVQFMPWRSFLQQLWAGQVIE